VNGVNLPQPIVDIQGDRTTATMRRGADAVNDLDKRISPSDVSYGSVLRAQPLQRSPAQGPPSSGFFICGFPLLSTSFSCLALQTISFEKLRARLDSHCSEERQLRV
jgi:hypothetical protein